MEKESHFEKNDSQSILSVTDNNALEFISALFTFEKTSLQTLMMDEESCHNKIFVNSQDTDVEEIVKKMIEDDEETFDYNLCNEKLEEFSIHLRRGQAEIEAKFKKVVIVYFENT